MALNHLSGGPLTGTENRGADANQGAALGDGRFQVIRHSHGESIQRRTGQGIAQCVAGGAQAGEGGALLVLIRGGRRYRR